MVLREILDSVGQITEAGVETTGTLAETKVTSLLFGVVALVAAILILLLFFIDPMFATVILVTIVIAVAVLLNNRQAI